jgi:hypothetical protein
MLLFCTTLQQYRPVPLLRCSVPFTVKCSPSLSFSEYIPRVPINWVKEVEKSHDFGEPPACMRVCRE